MKYILFAGLMLFAGLLPVFGITTVMVQDYEKTDQPAKMWGVNHHPDNAISISEEGPFEGKKCLQLNYHFVEQKNTAYIGIPNPANVDVFATAVRIAVRGDGSKCPMNLQLADASGETHQYKRIVYTDFLGWKEISVKLDAKHETWGGDNNGTIDYPIKGLTFTVVQAAELPAEGSIFFDAISIDTDPDVKLPEKPAPAAAGKMTAQSFEEDDSLPQVQSSMKLTGPVVSLVADRPYEGKKSLKLHYSFADVKETQYIRMVNNVRIPGPVSLLKFAVNGDGSGCSLGLQIIDGSGETHQYKGIGKLTFQGWQEITVNTVPKHEAWGGDKNGKIDGVVSKVIITVYNPQQLPAEGDLYFDAISAETGDSAASGNKTVPVAPAKLYKVLVTGYEKDEDNPDCSGTSKAKDVMTVLSDTAPFEGKKSVKLHYNFSNAKTTQYVRMSNKTRIEELIHKVRFMAKGNGMKLPMTLMLNDGSGETHVYKGFSVSEQTDWQEVAIDLDVRHESWGGDKDGVISTPVRNLTLTVLGPATLPTAGDLYIDALSVDSEGTAEDTVPVITITKIMVQDFEEGEQQPGLWGVNQSSVNEIAIVKDEANTGKQSLKLSYEFLPERKGQYLGIANPLRIMAPIHKLNFALKGDGSGCGVSVLVTDVSGESHYYKRKAVADYKGWKDFVIDLDGNHEVWAGGDKNGIIDLPVVSITFTVAPPATLPITGDLFFDSISVDSEKNAEMTIFN